VAVGVLVGVLVGVVVGVLGVGQFVETSATRGHWPSSWSCFCKPVSGKYTQKKSFGIVSYLQKISVALMD
jgi:hypothetical protein